MDRPISLLEYEAAARERLTTNAFDYYASGAHDELTLRGNRSAFERLCIAYRVLVDVSKRDSSTTVLGHPIRFPVIVAPTAFQRMAHPDGELATVRAAGSAALCSGTSSTGSCAAVAAVGRWSRSARRRGRGGSPVFPGRWARARRGQTTSRPRLRSTEVRSTPGGSSRRAQVRLEPSAARWTS